MKCILKKDYNFNKVQARKEAALGRWCNKSESTEVGKHGLCTEKRIIPFFKDKVRTEDSVRARLEELSIVLHYSSIRMVVL